MGEEQEQKFHQLTEEPVSRVISHLAVPCIISMLVTAFYNMADTYFVGTLGESAQAATGILFTVQAIMQGLAFMLGHGAGNVVYRLAKAKEMDYIDAGKALCEGRLWDEAAAQF